MARKRLRNHRRKNHPRDSDNDPEKKFMDEIAREAEQVPDTTSTDVSKIGVCMEVHGDEEWVRDYEETEEQNHGMEEGDKTTVGPPGIGEQMPLLTYSSSDTDSGRRKRIQHTHGCSWI